MLHLFFMFYFQVFKTPMQFHQTPGGDGGKPSPSRIDLWREQLGLTEPENAKTESESDSGDDPEVDQNYSKGMEF